MKLLYQRFSGCLKYIQALFVRCKRTLLGEYKQHSVLTKEKFKISFGMFYALYFYKEKSGYDL